MILMDSFHKVKYIHTFWQALKHTFGMAVIMLCILLLLIPASTSAIPDISIFNVDYTHNQMKYRFYLENINVIVNGAVILMGVVLAISLFRFMLAKRSSDAYFSLGITRIKLVIIHSFAGACYMALVLFISLFVSLLLNLMAFTEYGFAPYAISGFFYIWTGFFVLALVSFMITLLTCCLVGTIAETTFFSFIFIGSISILFYGISTLAKQLLFGNSFGLTVSTGGSAVSSNMVTMLESFNPALFFLNASKNFCAQYVRYDAYIEPDQDYRLCVLWIIVAVLLLIGCFFAIRVRKAEIAGVSGKCVPVNFFVTFLVSFLGFTVVLNTVATYGLFLAIIIAFLTFIVLYIILEKLQTRRLWKGLWKLPIQFGIVAFAVIILYTGGFGYSSRIPVSDQIKEVEMSYIGSPNYLSSDNGGTSNGKQYYVRSDYTYTKSDDVKEIIDVHRAIIDAGKPKLAVDMEHFSSTAVPYDIIIKYTLKSGNEITRYYDRTTMEVLEKMLSLDDTQTVHNNIQSSILSLTNSNYGAAGAYKNGLIYLNNTLYTNPKQVLMNADQRTKLLSCIAADVAAQSIEDRYFTKESAVGVIMFSLTGSQNSLTFAYNIENTLVYVTPNFTQTIQYLEDTNLYQYFQTTDEIENVSLQAYNPYISVVNTQTSPKSQYFLGYIKDTAHEFIQTKDFGNDFLIDTPERLAQVIPLLQNDYFMSRGGYLAQIKIKGKDKYVYKFLPAEVAPQFVIFNLRK